MLKTINETGILFQLYMLLNTIIIPKNIIIIIHFALIKGVSTGFKGFLFRPCKTSTPPQTKTKANKVPILHKSVTIVRFINNAGIPTIKPVTIVEKEGVLNFG